MGITDHKLKGLPAGWRVLMMKRATTNHIDAFVLCERDPPDERSGRDNFVTWYANLSTGGCHHGHYFSSMRDAEQDFRFRIRSIR